jgi:hypothetical protein
MKNLARLLTLTAAVGLAASLSAQTASDTTTPRGPHGRGPGGPGGRGHGPGNPLVRVLDADKDHVLSASELAHASAAILTLDQNGDGAVSADELHPNRPANAPARPARPSGSDTDRPRPADPLMLALDADGDGALSAAEIARASTSQAALDLNKDGQLTPHEFAPLPPQK